MIPVQCRTDLRRRPSGSVQPMHDLPAGLVAMPALAAEYVSTGAAMTVTGQVGVEVEAFGFGHSQPSISGPTVRPICLYCFSWITRSVSCG